MLAVYGIKTGATTGISVEWPVRDGVLVSEKDARCPPLREAETKLHLPSVGSHIHGISCENRF